MNYKYITPKPNPMPLLNKITHLGHAAFKIANGSGVIYIDPFKLPTDSEPADFIFITHEHFDHCSPEDLKKILKEETVIIAPRECAPKINRQFESIKPGEKKTISSIEVETIPAYNLDKFREVGLPYHPKEDGKVGYILTIDGERLYHAGDTDFIPEMENLANIDIALLPVSGTYVMTAEEAAKTANAFKPKVVIPMHFGDIVGSKKDAEKFQELFSGKTEII